MGKKRYVIEGGYGNKKVRSQASRWINYSKKHPKDYSKKERFEIS